jgi:hypothetical protein
VPNPNYCNGGKGAIGGPPSKGTAPMPKLYEALAEAFLAEGVDTQFVLMGDGCCDAHSISELGQGRRFGATAHNLRSTPVSRPSGGSTAGLLSARSRPEQMQQSRVSIRSPAGPEPAFPGSY